MFKKFVGFYVCYIGKILCYLVVKLLRLGDLECILKSIFCFEIEMVVFLC